MKNSDSKSVENGKTPKSVKAKSDVASGLRELLVDQLKDLYWAEKEYYKSTV